MKKGVLCLSIIFIMMLLCTSCDGPTRYLSTGNYELQYVTYYGLEDKENYPEELMVFNKLKYKLKEITEEEYEQANGQNVFIDIYSNYKPEKVYLYLEVYLYYIESEEVEKVECNNIEIANEGQNPYVYLGDCVFKINNVDYEGVIYLKFSTNKSGTGTQEIIIVFNEDEYGILFSEMNK